MSLHSSRGQLAALELAELDSTALHSHLSHLKRRALKSPASDLELSTAQLRKVSFPLGGSSLTTSCPRGGVLKPYLPQLTSLDLDQLELDALGILAQVLSFVQKASLLPQLSSVAINTKTNHFLQIAN